MASSSEDFTDAIGAQHHHQRPHLELDRVEAPKALDLKLSQLVHRPDPITPSLGGRWLPRGMDYRDLRDER